MKERIREDIMEMRREIEDEVIMEMAIEREISMRAEAGLMSSSLSSQPLGFQRNLQRTAGLFPIRTHQRLLERDGGEKAVPVLSGKNAGAVTDKGVSVDDGATRIDSDIGDKEDELLVRYLLLLFFLSSFSFVPSVYKIYLLLFIKYSNEIGV